MKLFREQVEDATFLIEENEDKGIQEIFIEGIFMQSNIKNRNGRIYPTEVLEKEVKRYAKEKVARKTAYGELGHPTNPTINPERISHMIVELKMDGKNAIGKAKLIKEGYGKIASAIIESGGTLGVSSRGLGQIKESAKGDIVEQYHLITAGDIVIDPSAPDAYMESIVEGEEWFIGPNGEWEKQVAEVKTILEETSNREEREALFMKKFQEFLNTI